MAPRRTKRGPQLSLMCVTHSRVFCSLILICFSVWVLVLVDVVPQCFPSLFAAHKRQKKIRGRERELFLPKCNASNLARSQRKETSALDT